MGKQEKSIIWLICLITLLALGVLILLSMINKGLLWDENAYLGNSRSQVQTSNFVEDFRFPLIEYIISAVWRITGESVNVARVIMILFTVLTIFITLLLMKNYFREKPAQINIIIGLSFALSPLLLTWGYRVYTDMMTLFFIVLAFYLLKKSESLKDIRGETIFLILCAISCALSFLSRFNALLFPFCIGLYLVYKKQYKKVAYFSIFFILAISPWMIYNYIHYHNILWDMQGYFNIVAQWTKWEPISKQILNLIYNTGLISLLFILGVFYITLDLRDKKNRTAENIVLLFYTIISLGYYLFFVNLKDSRYYLIFLPFIYILAIKACLHLDKLFRKFKLIKIIFITILILNLIALTVYGIGYSSKEQLCKGHAIDDTINFLAEKNIANTTIISNFWPYLGYGLNVKAASPWSTSLDELFGAYGNRVSYVVYSNKVGTEYNQTILDTAPRLKNIKQFVDKCSVITIYEVKY